MSPSLPDYQPALEGREGGTLLRVKAVPGASRAMIAGLLGDRIKVRVAAPPEGGKANAAIRTLLADALGVGKNMVSIVSGERNPKKSILVDGLAPAEVASLLGEATSRG